MAIVETKADGTLTVLDVSVGADVEGRILWYVLNGDNQTRVTDFTLKCECRTVISERKRKRITVVFNTWAIVDVKFQISSSIFFKLDGESQTRLFNQLLKRLNTSSKKKTVTYFFVAD